MKKSKMKQEIKMLRADLDNRIKLDVVTDKLKEAENEVRWFKNEIMILQDEFYGD